jgi:hypothetical protein
MALRNQALIPLNIMKILCCSVMLAMLPIAASGSEGDSLHLRTPTKPTRPDDTFTRMFPGLPAFAPATDEMREQAKRLGAQGGPSTRWISSLTRFNPSSTPPSIAPITRITPR